MIPDPREIERLKTAQAEFRKELEAKRAETLKTEHERLLAERQKILRGAARSRPCCRASWAKSVGRRQTSCSRGWQRGRGFHTPNWRAPTVSGRLWLWRTCLLLVPGRTVSQWCTSPIRSRPPSLRPVVRLPTSSGQSCLQRSGDGLLDLVRMWVVVLQGGALQRYVAASGRKM